MSPSQKIPLGEGVLECDIEKPEKIFLRKLSSETRHLDHGKDSAKATGLEDARPLEQAPPSLGLALGEHFHPLPA